MTKLTITNDGARGAVVLIQTKTANGDPAGVADIRLEAGESAESAVAVELKLSISEVHPAVVVPVVEEARWTITEEKPDYQLNDEFNSENDYGRTQ